MSSPEKRVSQRVAELRKQKDPGEHNRIRTSMILAAKISQALKLRGWSQQQLATQLNKKPSVISRWLSGTHNFTSDTLSDISLILEINLLDLSLDMPDVVASVSTANLVQNVFHIEGKTVDFFQENSFVETTVGFEDGTVQCVSCSN